MLDRASEAKRGPPKRAKLARTKRAKLKRAKRVPPMRSKDMKFKWRDSHNRHQPAKSYASQNIICERNDRPKEESTVTVKKMLLLNP